MDANQVLDRMSREQLVSLLYEILRRLLASAHPTSPAEVPCHETSNQNGQLIVDPTIDAWEHTGIYPQGFTPPQMREAGRPEGTQESLAPHFGRPSLEPAALPASTTGGALFVDPPCTAFSRPWQPGYPAPQLVPACVATEPAGQSDDAWAAPEGVLARTIENPTRNPVLPLDTLLTWQNRAVCSYHFRCFRPCVVTRVGHALHFCRFCIDQRPVGESRSGA